MTRRNIHDLEYGKFINQETTDNPPVVRTVSSDSNGNPNSVQYPLSADGDSVYCKDIWSEESISTGWTDEDSTGLDIICIPFTNLHTRIKNSTTDNPKILRIHFNRTVFATQVGLGCVGGDTFSNVKITLLGSGGVGRTLVDDSSDNTKYTSRNYTFTKQLFNAVQLEFHTTDTVCLSNITIQKATNVSVSQVEETTDSLKVINYSHAELHAGKHYFFRNFVDVPNSGTQDFLIVTPNTTKWAHMTIGVMSEAEATFELYEDTVTSNDGNLDNTRNRNRNYTDDNTTQVYESPTVTDTGTLIATNRFGSGRDNGGGSRDEEEIILKQNTKYLFRMTNNALGTSNLINYVFDWYEHTNKGLL